MKHAYLYSRYSSKRQAKGDTLKRQKSAANWCEENGYEVDYSTYQDHGVSGYSGKNLKGKLGVFLAACQAKRIRQGDAIVAENLDRITRQGVLESAAIIKQILDCGVEIILLTPYPRTLTRNTDQMEIFLTLLESVRAHNESEIKSQRAKKNWSEKRKLANTNTIITSHAPSWLRQNDDKWELIPDKVATIKRIFKEAEIKGSYSIAQELNKDGIPTLVSSKRWNSGLVIHVLRNRRVLGEYQPCDKDDNPVGDAIADYYPRIITDAQWYKVQDCIAKRKTQTGRKGNVINLFAGKFEDVETGQPCYIKSKPYKGRTYRYIQSAAANHNGAATPMLPYDVLETAILAVTSEMKASDLTDNGDAETELEALGGKLKATLERLAQVEQALTEDGDFSSLLKVAKTLEAKKNDLEKEIETLRGKATNNVSDTLAQLQDLPTELDPEQRERARALFLHLVEKIYCYFHKNEAQRRLYAQVHYTAGGFRRICIVCERRNTEWFAHETKRPNLATDIRDKATQKKLANLAQDTIWM